MNRHEYYVEAIKAGRWKWRAWRTSIFAITTLPEDYVLEVYDLNYKEDGVYFYNQSKEWELIEGSLPNVPLLDYREAVDYPLGIVPNQGDISVTTPGRILFNAMVTSYAFGDRIPFATSINEVVKQFVSKVKDEPTDGNYEKDFFYPSEIMRFQSGCYELGSLCEFISPTGSTRTLTTHPDLIEYRTKLYEEARKEGPITAAKVVEIQNKCIALDKEWATQGDDKDYYISGSSFNVKRKKMFVTMGMETAFKNAGDFQLIEKSLAEGSDFDPKVIVAENNSTREGSYDRGADTALGGAIVNVLQRIFQNHYIAKGDCGTTLYDQVQCTTINMQTYIGFNAITETGLVEIDEKFIEANLNKTIKLRRPILCKGVNTDTCECCAGNALSRSPRSVASEIVDIGSRIMYAFMQSMHGTSQSLARYDYLKELT